VVCARLLRDLVVPLSGWYRVSSSGESRYGILSLTREAGGTYDLKAIGDGLLPWGTCVTVLLGEA